MCVIDWSALGTWITGVAVAYLAWQANRIQKELKAATDRRSKSMAESAAAAIYYELAHLRKRANAILDNFELVKWAPVPCTHLLSRMPSFALRNDLIDAECIGELSEPLARKIGVIRAMAAEFQTQVESVTKTFSSPDLDKFDEKQRLRIVSSNFESTVEAMRFYGQRIYKTIEAIEAEHPKCRDLATSTPA